MASLSVCQPIAPMRDGGPTQEQLRSIIFGAQAPLFVAESHRSTWTHTSAQAIVEGFDRSSSVSMFVTPTGVVGYYNTRKVKAEIRDGRIWGKTTRDDKLPTTEFELPHLQLDTIVNLQWYLDYVAKHRDGAYLVDPREQTYLRACDNALSYLQPAMAPAIPLDAGTMARVSLYLSQKGIVTNAHLDMHSGTIHQIKGRKRVLFFPPQEIEKFQMFPLGHMFARRSAIATRITEATLAEHRQLAQARGYECIIEPNQWLYIPALWLHYVETLDDDTVSIITRFRR